MHEKKIRGRGQGCVLLTGEAKEGGGGGSTHMFISGIVHN